MSFIYSMLDTWNAIGTTFNSISMNVSNGSGGAPVGATASRILNLQANGTSVFTVDIAGKTFIGTNFAGAVAPLNVNANTVAPPTATSAATLLHLVAANNLGLLALFDAWNGTPTLQFRRADGTAAAPSALLINEVIGAIFSTGYGATSYTSRGVIRSAASENWTDTAQGTYYSFLTTNTGTIAIAEAVRINPSGGFSIGTTSDPGVGLLYTNSAAFISRSKTSLADGAAAQAGTLLNAPAAGNPTKWLPYDDNGTTRYIPSW